MLVFDAHESASPFASDADVFVELFGEVLAELLEVGHVFLSHFSESKASQSFLVDELAESFFAFNKAEWDTLLPAESWKENNDFDGVNIMGNDNKLSFALLHKSSHVVDSEFDVEGFGSLLGILFVLFVLGFLLETLLLFLLVFWLVLVQ